MLKKLLLTSAAIATSSAALAADLPRRAAPPVFTPVAPVFSKRSSEPTYRHAW